MSEHSKLVGFQITQP